MGNTKGIAEEDIIALTKSGSVSLKFRYAPVLVSTAETTTLLLRTPPYLMKKLEMNYSSGAVSRTPVCFKTPVMIPRGFHY